MGEYLLEIALKTLATAIIAAMVIFCLSSCSTTKKVEQAPMKKVAVPYWG